MTTNRTVRDFETALEQLLQKKSFEHLTVDEICSAALLHRSSFYRYFHDKYDLLEHLITSRVNEVVEQSSSENDLIETGIRYISEHKKVFRNISSGGPNRAIFAELIRIISDVLLKQAVPPYRNTISQIIGNSPQPALTAYALGGAFMGACFWWENHDYSVSPEELIAFTKNVTISLNSISWDSKKEKELKNNVGND